MMRNHALKIITVSIAAWSLCGCASLCDQNDSNGQCAKETAEDIGVGAVAAALILSDPEPTITTETCSTDWYGNKTCVTKRN